MESSSKAESLAQRIARSEREFEARVLQRLGTDARIVTPADARSGAEGSAVLGPNGAGRTVAGVDVPPRSDDAGALAP